ncbi:pimeloyl-ACP methyl ester carboxylesterase [Kibdelosporangium banguiense]|uniref:Pimeloyl-ACP methyl ester carboxylesterase n=1 Tax=Kibdelosporangium banguiense TaxID=1365924 RepID=A0ABS4T6M5_9PSEU|nr:alpha/beta fold hydrolase [Kibdelosporangium banguiense]MBP2320069.1 pimeloyl-ACP methyl ester carboxylesterase [Kibdelosporangium banguiense]
MQAITRAFGVALVSGALVLSAGLTSAQAAEIEAVQVAAIDWKPCPEDATADCGTLRLPIDHRKPSGEKFDLAVARRKATDPAKRAGIMLINPGGPGGSGVNFALSAKNYFSADIQSRFDIIGWDPRGVARSQPVKCSLELLNKAPTTYPANQAEFDAMTKFNRELRDDCRKRSGPIADHADTGATIQDMDAIRRSLGEKKINYYGVSYGTLMGQQYAERYGDKIRAMVIDSNMDHSLGTWGFATTEAASAESSFNEWVKWCDRTVSCALHGKDVAKVWDGLLAKADRGEVTDPSDPTVKVTARDIINQAFGAFYGPDFKPLTDFVVALDSQKPVGKPAFAADQEVGFVFQAAFCGDWSLPIRSFGEYKALEATENALAPHMRGGSLGHTAITACTGLPEKVNNPQHRLDIDNAPEILMLNSLYDPATAYAWAVNAHRQSRDTTVLLTYEGWGHGVYGRSECTTVQIDNYLATLKAPKDGARCEAVEPPATAALSAEQTQRPAGPKPGIPGWAR